MGESNPYSKEAGKVIRKLQASQHHSGPWGNNRAGPLGAHFWACEESGTSKWVRAGEFAL